VHRIVLEQMGVGLNRAEVVDGDDLDVLAAGFVDGAQDEAADAAETVDRDFYGNISFLLMRAESATAKIGSRLCGLK